MQKKTKFILLRVIFVAALLALIPLFGGVGSKLGLWEPMTGFRMTMNYMNYSAIAALVVLFMLLKYGLKDLRNTVISFVALVACVLGGYIYGVNQEPTDWTGLRGVNDISTDKENPPQFEALLDAPGRTNSLEYSAETVARQSAKFPWVQPVLTDLSAADAYTRAVGIATDLGWEVTGEDPDRGRFEATDYTKWFYFHDDLVVRITAETDGSRVDLRSSSRVGGSDHGLGAIRIMKFTEAFNSQ
ncbi:MAG: DUF1499 domain-containing protein [Porticoccaceae bacterium]|jgi:uncharacterized protein (DUF1499 family)|nr:DUF1499 domain-containing protein [Porticoccaceae bacterium]